MNTRVESMGGLPDMAKWVLASALVICGLVGFYLFSDQSLLLRVVGLLLLLGGAIVVAAGTGKGREVAEFLRESRIELRKVVWPTRQETTQTTLVVVVMVCVVSLLLWALDSILSLLIRMLLNVGG